VTSRSQLNPYDNPYPIDHLEDFYGRRELMSQLLHQLVEDRPFRSKQIVGLLQSGKTSLFNALRQLNHPCYRPYAEALQLKPQDIEKILFVFVSFAGISTYEPTVFWKYVGRQIGKALEEHRFFEQACPKKDTVTTFEEIKTLLEWLTAKQILTVFLFDDFDHVALHLSRGIAQNLRFLFSLGAAQTPGGVAYITATIHTLSEYIERSDDKQALPLLLPYFDRKITYLGLFEKDDPQSLRSFIQKPAQQYGVAFTDEDIQFVLSIGGRYPYLTRIVCLHLFEAHRSLDSWSQPINYDVITQEVYEDVKPLYQSIWFTLSEAQKDILIRIVTGSGISETPEQIRNQLINLGLIKPTRSASLRYDFCSPVVVTILHEMSLKEVKMPELIVWPEQRAVQIQDRLEILSPNEWKLFSYLRDHADRVCSREELLQAVFPESSEFRNSALDIVISRLRQKIDGESDRSRIVTVRGQGYRYEDPQVSMHV
jgi:DNA-binding winged helix-turn-helix (wHTH) protein